MDNPRSTLAQIRQERLDKVEKLKQLGINSYPSKAKRDVHLKDIVSDYDSYDGKTLTVAGRLVSKREHGALFFGHIQDQTGQLQLYIKGEELLETSKEKQTIGFSDLNLIDVGDIVQATGVVTKTNSGEVSLLVKEFKILTKAIRPLPDKHQGIKDKETLFRQRYLDMIMHPEKMKKFEIAAKILFNIRAFMDSKGFLEIKTPIIQPVYGGSSAKPFMTTVNALGEDFYLAIAHELYLKRLIVAGFENVFNIVGYFRNEGIDRTHNPEFNILETMSAYENYEFNMDLTEEMYKYIAKNVFDKYNFKIKGQEVDLQKPWAKITMLDAVKKYANYDFDQVKSLDEAHKILDEIGYQEEKPKSIGESMFKVFEAKVEEHLIEPVFIYGHPVEISPLAKRMEGDKRFVERFEVFMGGMEAGDNWTELNDPVELFERFKEQHNRKLGGDEEAHPMDIEFIEAMEYGMPPTTGLGPGIERLAMMFTESEYIDDVIFFPMMRRSPVTKIQKEIYGEEYVGLNVQGKKETNDPKISQDTKGLPNKGDALKILEKYVKDEYQFLHAKMVGAALEDLAEKYNEDKNLWYITGLFHDLDFDKHPDEHPNTELEWFKEWGYPEAMIHAVAAHAYKLTDVMPKTVLANAILAVDEFAGLLYAYSKMKDGRFDDMKVKSIRKKFKDKGFARKIDREDVQLGIDGLGIDFGELAESLIKTFSNMKEFSGEKDYTQENVGNKEPAVTAKSGNQDMSKKIVIVVNEDLENWKVLNTVGHISAYLGNQIDKENFHSGRPYKTKTGESFDRSGQYPIVVLKTGGKALKKLNSELINTNLIKYPFLAEHLEVKKDEDIDKVLRDKNSDELEYYGIGIWGDRDKIDELTSKYSLWK